MALGVKLHAGLPIERGLSLARHAEARGLDSVWVSEYRGEAVTLMALLAAGTERLTIGSSILPIYTRSPPVLAATAASLNALAPGRVILGLGSSTERIIERWHGVPRRRALRAMEDYVSAIRAILSGERAETDGEVYAVRGFQLQDPRLAAPATPIYTAGLGRRGLELAGRVADGALLNAYPVDHLPRIRSRVDAGSVAAGRPPGAVALAGDVQIAVASGARARRLRAAVRGQTAVYATTPQYGRLFAEAGFAAEAEAARAAWSRGDRDGAVAAIGAELPAAIATIGSERQVAEHLAAVGAAGLDHALVYPVFEGEPDYATTRRTIDLIAELRGGG